MTVRLLTLSHAIARRYRNAKMSYEKRHRRRTIRDPKRKWDFVTWWFVVRQNLKGIWTSTRVLFGMGRIRKKRLGRISKITRLTLLGPGARCIRCGDGWYEKELTLDHIVPASKGGKGNKKNLQVMCEDCNQKKGDRVKKYHSPDLKVSVKERIDFQRRDDSRTDRT